MTDQPYQERLGGRYVRRRDGSLERVEGPGVEPPAVEPASVEPPSHDEPEARPAKKGK